MSTERERVTAHIRPEQHADRDAVRVVNELAFGRAEEARVVERLRAEADPYVALVAVLAARVVGHIVFTSVTVGGAPRVLGLGLGPMAVLPDLQRHGIGSSLIEAGLAVCRGRGYEVIVVLGHEAYYPRFGFRPASQSGLRCKWPVPDGAFMALELRPGTLGAAKGLVEYHPAFDET